MNWKCSVEGCKRTDRANSEWCRLHYKRWYRHGDPSTTRKTPKLDPNCAVDGCPGRPVAKGLCGNHYALRRRNGAPVRTRIFVGQYIKDGYRFVLVGTRTYEPEHRIVMARFLHRQLRSDEHVHHIDGDTLNNSPSNLQIVTASEHLRIHAATRPRGHRGRYKKG